MLLENNILQNNVERLKAENKRLEGIEESSSIEGSQIFSGENLYNELAAIERREKLDKSTQAEMESRVGPEAMISGKNEDLINVTQSYSKRASHLFQVPKQSLAVKSQFSAASAQSRKQIIYAPASFILSGAFAIGTSLGISITLALAALTFFTLGCYCSYKASTTLRNIELDQTLKMANHEAVFTVPSL